MLNSAMLDVALGMIFCWGAVALIASSIYESIASLFKLRANDLLNGVKELLNDKEFTGLARTVYKSGLVNPRDPGRPNASSVTVKPSYIHPMHFAAALIEAIQGAPDAVEDFKMKIEAINDEQVRTMLLGMYTRAGGKIEEVQKQIADWFNSGMERISGVYKRKAQLFSFLIALLVAFVLDIDTFKLFKALWLHPANVASLSVPDAAAAALSELKKLPVGRIGWAVTAASIPGWLATACSAPFGSPFWFGLLQRLVNLRGTGPKPAG